MYPTEMRGNRCQKAKLQRLGSKHMFPAHGPFFLHIHMSVFLFPVGEFVLPSHRLLAKARGW